MPVRGYPVTDLSDTSGKSHVQVDGVRMTIGEGKKFVSDFPPAIGEQVFQLVDGDREAVGDVFENPLSRLSLETQRWEVRRSA